MTIMVDRIQIEYDIVIQTICTHIKHIVGHADMEYYFKHHVEDVRFLSYVKKLGFYLGLKEALLEVAEIIPIIGGCYLIKFSTPLGQYQMDIDNFIEYYLGEEYGYIPSNE